MDTATQLREGMSRAWDTVSEGWREFRDLAGNALTRFQPKTSRSEVESAEDRIVSRASRWGLLAAEVADTSDSIEVMLEAPGLDADDFEIEVIDDHLVIRGQKRVAREIKHGHYHLMERAYGQFTRAVPLPSKVDDANAQASYQAGVLTIVLPKTTTHTTRRIKVDS